MRILGVDYGTKITGFAVSNEEETMALSHKIYEMCGNRQTDIDRIAKIVEESDCAKIVVGLPVKMDGSHTIQTKKVLEFAERLKSITKKDVICWDEGGTTKHAQDMLREVPIKRDKRKTHLNTVSAQLILQSYLDSKSTAL